MAAFSPSPLDYKVHSLRYALHYLAAGRFAVASWFTPVSVNLLHHAVELLLKGSLVERCGFDALPKGKTGHDLPGLWKLYTDTFKDARLDKFAPVMQELQKFEDIRYPERLIGGGGFFSVGFDAVQPNTQVTGPRAPEYIAFVDHIDELFQLLLEIANVNPEFFLSELHQNHASKYFFFRNKFPLCAPPPNNSFERTREG